MLAASSAIAQEQPWGGLKGRFVYGGPEVPEQPKLELNKDMDFCGPHDPRDESLVVDPKTKGIANIVIWLDETEADGAVPVHDSYVKAAAEPAVVGNEKCRFVPHVQVARTGQPLALTNGDPIAHAAAFFFLKNDPINVTLAPGGKEQRTAEKPETLPIPITCPIHAWMKGWLIVKPHPYVAVSGKDGSIELKNLPAGEWTFRVWQETSGFVDEVTVGGEATKWRSGRFKVTIEAGKAHDLGDVTIAAEMFDE